MMELLAPAGNLEKLKYAYLYGADAAYIGLQNFSLRTRADNFSEDQARELTDIKGDKKLYGALNAFFHNGDIRKLEEFIPVLEKFPFDAFIVSDPGAIRILGRRFPDIPLHLSTQANCLNIEAVRFYQDAGVKRIILGREASLEEIAEIRNGIKDIELEVFAHGAMCLAYSGRCFLSRWMADRSANSGFCAHSCRWKYRYLEEEERPGEYYPVIEGEGFTTILSSKDMCMIDYLDQLQAAGVDSIKIEGRMKSLYYAAVVTRAYRKALDRLAGEPVKEFEGYREELFKVSHREYSTGFFFGKEEIEQPTEKSYQRLYKFLGTVGKPAGEGRFHLEPKNQIRQGQPLEFIGPDMLYLPAGDFILLDELGKVVEKADHGKKYFFVTKLPIKEGYIIRTPVPDGNEVKKQAEVPF